MQVGIQKYEQDKEYHIPLHASQTVELSRCLRAVADNKDKHAFTLLFQFFAPKIKQFGISKLNSDAMANELIQETMTNVWKKAHLYQQSKGAATTWVFTIMRNTSFDMLRKMKTQSEHIFSNNIWPLEDIGESTTQHHNFSDHLQDKQLLNCIDTLPPAQQEVVKGIYYDELSQEQLAKRLNVPLGTVKSRLRLALSKLKQQLGEQHHD
ncbi:sigma-70 family RNA polymerase sigma factor [uncultured Shewanella sp.]|uniref:sigma-70 family RNA polymerase sigma factor n=1 Tax=uncultured Shewanella sp. TaxID=173975 RepID=UPI00261C77B0|nr:sigma-70 family RNA polymerase sigma factor [uncultured Shewanella sp.]